MKKLLFTFLLIYSSLSYGQATRADFDVPNPHRGMYINNFFVLNTSWNGGTPPYPIVPNVSILGTDADRDGIFEKERELLEYCRDNHITFIVLLNLHQLFGSGVLLWNENLGREVPIEEHLCRFMNEARNNYCIDQIGAAADNANAFEDINNIQSSFTNHTPPISIPSILRTSFANVPNINLIEDSTLTPPDPRFYESECLKFYYRAAFFTGTDNCQTFFNYLHMEYEYWQNSFWDDYTTYSVTCTTTIYSSTITTNSVFGIEVGSPVSGIGIPSGSTVTSVGLNSFTISNAATASGTNTLNFIFVTDNTINSICCNNSSQNFTCTVVSGSNVISTSSSNGIYINSTINGPGLPPGSIITNVGATTFTINQNATSSQTGAYTIDSQIQEMSTNNCATSTGPHRWYNRTYAKYFSHFKPTIRAMNRIAYSYNSLHNYQPNDIHYMRLDAYLQEIDYDAAIPVTIPIYNDFITFLDGTGGPVGANPPPTDCQILPSHSTANGDPVDQEGRIDRLCPHAFVSFANYNPPLHNNFSYFYNDMNDLNRVANLHYWTSWHTDIHPILSSENIRNGGYDDYWGRWFQESSINNIFQAEKLFYKDWRQNSASYYGAFPFENNENSFHPGGFLWFTQSYMVKPLNKPCIFVPELNNCSAVGTDINYHYIGPTESGIDIRFKIVSNDYLTRLFPSNGSGLPWLVETTKNHWNPVSDIYAADDILATNLPVVSSSSLPHHAIVQLTFEGNCQYIDTFDVVILNGPSIQAMGPVEFCQGESVTLQTAVANISPTTIQWFKTGSSTVISSQSSITVRESGNYYCVVSGSTGACNGNSNSISVNVKPFPFNTIMLDCSGSASYNMFVGPIISGTTPQTIGPGGLTYSWSTSETVDRITASPKRWYFLTVTSPNGCAKTENIYYTGSGSAPTITVTSTDPSPACASNGSAIVTIPTGDVVHATLSNGITTQYLDWPRGGAKSLTNLSPGNYTVYVAMSGGSCYSSQSFTIGTQSATLVANFSHTNASCNGGNNGSITLNSVAGYSGLINVEIPSIGLNVSNISSGALPIVLSNSLTAGIYIIKISDGTCNFITQTITITQPAPINLTFTPTDVSICHESTNGAAHVTASNGTPPYSYSWNVTPTVTSQDITVRGFGTYSVLVSDNNGCSITGSVSLTAPQEILLTYTTQPSSSCTGNNGSASVTVTGGSPSYAYSWAPIGGTGSTAINLPQGNYSCTVTDANGCTATTGTIVIIGTSTLTSTIDTHQDDACGTGAGSAHMLASGGSQPYNYSWAPSGGNLATANLLTANTYTCTVTDNAGCTSSSSITILSHAISLGSFQTNVRCNGGNTGSASVTTSGGTPPFIYSWTGSTSTSATASNLIAGNYTCTVTDNDGCIASLTFIISQPAQALAVTFQNIGNPCIGGSSGSVTAAATGGTPSYSYSWNTVPVQNTAQASGLTAGTYIVTVTDGNGCITSASYSVTENSSCCGDPLTQIIPAPGNIPNTTYSNNWNLSFPATVSSGTVTFSDIDLFIASGVSITINSGATLIIEANSLLHACGDMWAGIINNGTLIIENSTIEDALNAVTTSSGNQIQITGAIFDHNYTSLRIENGNFNSSNIRSSIFRCSGGYSLKAPYLGQRTLNQIRISNADVTIGDPTYLSNDFSGSDVGIQMESLFSSGVNLYNNYFHNFDINTQNSNPSGMAIYATKMKFTLGSFGGGRSNNFYDNYLGVLFTSCSAPTIEYNNFDNIAGGIFGMFNFGAAMEINHNTMSNMMQGISMIWNPKSNINIRENTIQNVISSSFLGSGISVGESDFFGSNNGTYLWRNVIHSEGNYGIYLNNLAHSKFIENRVYLDQSTVNSSDIAIGIRVDNSDNNYLSCNEVDNKASTDPANKYGISVYDYFKQTMESNTTNGTAFGIQLISNCEGSYYLANSIQNHTEDGLLIGDVTNYVNTYVEPLVTYNAELPGNLWYNNTWDTHNYYQPILPQLFTKNGPGNPDYPRYNTAIGGPVIVPFPQPGLNLHQPLTCNIPVVEVGTENERKFDVVIAEQIASSQLQTFSQDIVSEWKAKTALYQSLKEDPSQIGNSTILAQFYNDASNGNIGKLTDIKQFLKDSQDSIVQNDSALKANLEQNAKSLNDGFIPEILPELNEKIVTDVYLNTVARNNFHFESQYVSDLMSVGLQCIYDGGPAVLKARNLLHSQYPFLLFNDYDLCNNTSFRKSGKKPTSSLESPTDLFVYPNPTTNQISCLFNKGTLIEITDLTGRVVAIEKIPENSLSLSINISDLMQGAYIVILKDEIGILKQTKLNVVR